MTDEETIARLAILLDAVMPLIRAEADAERIGNAGRTVKCITWRERLKGAEELLEWCAKEYDLPVGEGEE